MAGLSLFFKAEWVALYDNNGIIKPGLFSKDIKQYYNLKVELSSVYTDMFSTPLTPLPSWTLFKMKWFLKISQ